MPTFYDFAENGELFQAVDKPLNSENVSRYISEQGLERAKGYQDALVDMLKMLGPKVWTRYKHEGHSFHPSEPSTLRRSMIPVAELFSEQDQFLRLLTQLTSQRLSAAPNDDTNLKP